MNTTTLASSVKELKLVRKFGLPLLDLNAFDLTQLPLNLISIELVRKHLILPLAQRDRCLFLGVANPTNKIALDEIKFHTGCVAHCVLVEEKKLTKVIAQILNAQEFTRLENLTANLPKESSGDTSSLAITEAEDAPIVGYVQKILLEALKKGASDIHFEPYEKAYRIRFRIDGVLYENSKPALSLSNQITARIKILAQLDISEKRLPQDGRFKIVMANGQVADFRVSSCPTIFGEKVVIRILTAKTNLLNIDVLGFESRQREIFQSAIAEPQGLILVTGPTGSGKTLTLYSALNLLNTSKVNILTVEDPVEIYLPGINQVIINSKAGLDFATILRGFLRQDPDIIMIGEIRDFETADIALKAAQTGHLVLATLHTNSAADTLTRLLNMGVARYNLTSSISLIIAQRLARKLCEHCKYVQNIPRETLIQEGFQVRELAEFKPYAAGTCDQCTAGYKGRIGIFELIPMTEKIKQLMLQDMDLLAISQQAKKESLLTLRESGLNKVKRGVTSLNEINRVIPSLKKEGLYE